MVNPDRLALETDYENNAVECTIDLSAGIYYDRLSLVKDSCRISGENYEFIRTRISTVDPVNTSL